MKRLTTRSETLCTCPEIMKRKKAEKIDTIRLIWEEIGKDEDGFEKNEEVSIDAFCKEKSVTRMEAYESMRAGVSVQAVFEIRQEDWEETRHIVNGKPEYARKAEHDGRRYNIVRTYKAGKAKIEVVCG